MSIINETKKYLHMLVKMLVFILILCAFKLVESFFEVKRMPEVYAVSYLAFAYFILARLFSERKEKLMIVMYIIADTAAVAYFLRKGTGYMVLYLIFFFILSVIMVLVYYYFNKNEKKDKKRKFLIFLIPCYFLFIKLIFAITYIYLHIDEYNIFSLWYL
ncbi:hypothetical protein [Sebaldella sp. S0638]|uniref:hypothetical protein n=1 Tax=Sebaldella sp. S0638 TaxID=2957809 RepID=UPI0020A176A0|nr:hypothetical protein [Sebaldella sp. S0638]MCP1224747.1 hypothetical protein [Sebaldella sp. S0638]